ncbi:MAG: hypothetical protein LBS49_11295 [Candidatus Accumulibacter sp.]|nr:hypothetical protein [Accumulibacter sp.]
MLGFLKRLSQFEHKRSHGHRHGQGSSGMPRQEIFMRNDALAFEKNRYQCPLCEKHCPLSDPGCREGIAFAKKERASARGG